MSKTFPVKSSTVSTRGRGAVNRGGNNTRTARGGTLSNGRPNPSRGHPAIVQSTTSTTSRHLDSGTAFTQQLRGGGTEHTRMDRQGATGGGRQPPGHTANNPDSSESQQQRMSYQGSYTMITPDEKRRQRIAAQAQRETENYENYRQQNRLQHVNYVGTVGGSGVTETDARKKSAQEQRSHKLHQLEKQQKWRDEKKRSEDLVYEKKKIEGRNQTERNRQRTRTEQESKDIDRRRTNDAFLARIERENKQIQAKKKLSKSSAILQQPQSIEERQVHERHEGTQASNTHTEYDFRQNTEDNYDFQGSSEELEQLQTMFPHCESDFLKQILESVDNDVEEAMVLLTDD